MTTTLTNDHQSRFPNLARGAAGPAKCATLHCH